MSSDYIILQYFTYYNIVFLIIITIIAIITIIIVTTITSRYILPLVLYSYVYWF